MNGTIFMKPLPTVITVAVIANVAIAVTIILQSPPVVKPADLTATPAKPKVKNNSFVK